MRSINRHVSLLFRMGERFLNRKLAGSGVSSGTAPLLLELRYKSGCTPSALAAAVGVDKSHVTRALQSLKQAGYVEITPGTSDGRIVTVALTKKGGTATKLVEESMLSWIAIVSRGVSRAQLETINAVFDTFYSNAMEYFKTE
jgi:DNA-binding MarR family transcriptional regulator